LLCALAGLALAGCGRGPERVEVEGVVTLDGKPLPNVEVVFLPDPERGSTGPRAAALTDAEGRYHLRSDKGEDGAAVGKYRVLIVDNAARSMSPGKPAALAGGADDAAPAAGGSIRKPGKKGGRVPVRYGSVTATPFTGIEVTSGKQRHDFKIRGADGGS
jgi:hypothetical protein